MLLKSFALLLLLGVPLQALANLSISFTLASYRKGEFTNHCRSELLRAEDLGFASVLICPAYAYDAQSNQILTGTTINPGEVTTCLDEAWKQGFNIIFEPHMETPATLAGTSESSWRAGFDMHPDEVFRKEALSEFYSWVHAHAEEIQQSPRTVDLVPAAELERSTTAYPSEWVDLIQKAKAQLHEDGLDGRVRIGLNLNWFPAYDPEEDQCDGFAQLIHVADFIAPSFYGDWSHTDDGVQQVDDRKQEVLGYLERESSPWWQFHWLRDLEFWLPRPCTFDEVAQKPFAVGEISVDGLFIQASANTPISGDIDSYMEKRRQLYRNLLDWEKTQPAPARPLYLNIWTVGEFDPVEVDAGDTKYPDPQIADWIRAAR